MESGTRPTLIEALVQYARQQPEKVALRDAHAGSGDTTAFRQLSWGELAGAVMTLRARLQVGSTPGSVLLVAINNRLEFHIAFFAALAADLAVFPVGADLTETELQRAASRTEAWAVVGDAKLCGALGHLPGPRIPISEIPLAEDHAPGAKALGDKPGGQGSLLLHSSGSTAQPKIVQRSSRSLDAEAANCVRAVGFTPEARVLLAVPLHHSYGLEHGLLGPMYGGASVDLVDGFDPVQTAHHLADQPITHLPGVPFMYEALVRLDPANALPKRSSDHLTHAYSAGGPLPPGVFERVHQSLGLPLGQVYGSTEIGSVTFNDPSASGFDPASVGRPMDGVEIRVLNPDDPRVNQPLSPGSEGLVAIQAPSMLDGYVDEPTTPLVEGYFFTDDLGWIDSHHGLHLTGRATLLINVGGRKVNPGEIEAVLTEHPGVREAVIVPVEVTPTVSRLRAVVVAHPGQAPSESQLREHARAHLSGYKVPRSFEWRSSLPRTATGKVMRDAL